MFICLIFLLKARTNRNVATEPWFIGMMVSIVLLIIILINVCILVRERGGKYSGKLAQHILINDLKKNSSNNVICKIISIVQEKEPFQNQILSSDSQGFDEYQKG